ncbi:hypothetical protein [Streptomyces sp. NPDC016626]|uniref:LmrA/YxaF family transcription factor n=1 Tax=Streptomyces sp. NPDC016626 TaxID=3364968 RepID=UPI0036F72FE4
MLIPPCSHAGRETQPEPCVPAGRPLPAGLGAGRPRRRPGARGSLRHSFPGGEGQLVGEAVGRTVRHAGDRVARFPAALPEPTPGGPFAETVRQRTDEYRATGFGGGCPVAAATVDRADSAESTREAASAAFARWTGAAARAPSDTGRARRARPAARRTHDRFSRGDGPPRPRRTGRARPGGGLPRTWPPP